MHTQPPEPDYVPCDTEGCENLVFYPDGVDICLECWEKKRDEEIEEELRAHDAKVLKVQTTRGQILKVRPEPGVPLKDRLRVNHIWDRCNMRNVIKLVAPGSHQMFRDKYS